MHSESEFSEVSEVSNNKMFVDKVSSGVDNRAPCRKIIKRTKFPSIDLTKLVCSEEVNNDNVVRGIVLGSTPKNINHNIDLEKFLFENELTIN